MSGLVTLDDNVVEFNDPRLGIDPQGLQNWIRELKETAGKTDQLAKVVIEIRVKKWITPQVTESERLVDGKKTIVVRTILQNVLHFSNPVKIENVNDFSMEVKEIDRFLDKATSYGVVFSMKAYQSNDTLVGSISRKYGRIDKKDLKAAHEAVNKPIQLPPMTVNVGGRTRTLPSRQITRPMPPMDPKAEFEILFDSLENN